MYGRNAEEVKSALLAAHPGLSVIINPEKPRRNSFEITLLNEGNGEQIPAALLRLFSLLCSVNLVIFLFVDVFLQLHILTCLF